MWSVKATGRVALCVSLMTLCTVIYVNIYGTRNQSTAFFQSLRQTLNTSSDYDRSTNTMNTRNNSTRLAVLDYLDERTFHNVIMKGVKDALNTTFQLEHNVKFNPETQQLLKQLNLGNIRWSMNHSISEISIITDLLKNIMTRNSETNGESATANNPDMTRPLLILFTTWAKNPNKYDLCNATVHNWASLRPAVQPVLFSNDYEVANQVIKFGWKVLNIPKAAAENGLPILKYMYMDARRTFNAVFYAYSNSDILFTGNLHKSLSAILYSEYFRRSKHILISGVRTNLINFTESDANTKQALRKSASERGTNFLTSAEDYFITDKTYPWEDMPEVVIGSMAYDNWLVADARNRQFTTIDITTTSLAVHISHEANQFDSHSRDSADYNKSLLGKLFGNNVNYFRGFTDCMAIGTETKNDVIMFVERTEFAHYC